MIKAVPRATLLAASTRPMPPTRAMPTKTAAMSWPRSVTEISESVICFSSPRRCSDSSFAHSNRRSAPLSRTSLYCPNHKGTGQRGREPGWRRVRAFVLARDGYACVVCGQAQGLGPALELGHVIPKRKGGSNDPSNLRTLCRAHHEDKGGVRRAYKGASAREP